MGILNVTPDSFFNDSRVLTIDGALHKCDQMLKDGADFIDIGAQSTRPGATAVDADVELERLIPVLSKLTTEFPQAIFSIDTYYSEVAKEAISAGGHIINDISGGTIDPTLYDTVAHLQVPYILGHIQGTPVNMNNNPSYTNVVLDVVKELSIKLNALHLKGVNDIIVDPGFGFGKTVEQNFSLLNHLDQLTLLDKPIAIGISRKSMIWKTLECRPEESLHGTTALHMVALQNGASIIRVHDVKEARACIALFNALKRN